MRRDRLRVVVSGMVAGVPGQGGAAWAVANWVLGFVGLGHDVVLVEEVDRLTPVRRPAFEAVAAQTGLRGRAALVAPGGASHGLAYGDVARACRQADVLVNLAGTLRDPELRDAPPHRAYVDLDPGFTQVWHHQGIDVGLPGHTAWFSVGLNVGGPAWALPTGGMAWVPTLPPVALARWRRPDPAADDPWTTVGHWRGYGSAEHEGVVLGQRVHSWRDLLALPRRTTQRLRPALAIHPAETADIATLEEHGWAWVDPADVAADPRSYREFVGRSQGELGVAKHGYVATGSGWFSDRSACYLAAGRPVVAQDTGWSAHLPAGEGLLAFSTVDEAADALDRAAGDPGRHRAAARRLAADAFDATVVADRLLETVLTPSLSGATP